MGKNGLFIKGELKKKRKGSVKKMVGRMKGGREGVEMRSNFQRATKRKAAFN